MTATLRARARALFAIGLAAADPARAVRASLAKHPVPATRIIAVGKAALPMLRAAREFVPEASAIAVTNRENVGPASSERVLVAGHPVPDAGGEAAARAVEAFARDASEGETVLVLVSGGGSAMLPAPIEGITLVDKIAVTELLLSSGAPIDAINTVRRALSRLKGGGLARLIHPARTVALLLSDVPRDEIAAIASGPTVPVREKLDAALAVLRRFDVLDRVPGAVRAVLERSAMERPVRAPLIEPNVENRLVGGNGVSVRAMVDGGAEAFGNAPHAIVNISDWLDGDVADAAARLHRAAREAPPGDVALVTGGETTVVLRGSGRGGRNQELSLRFAMLCEETPLGRPWAFLSGGTDGRDGPTDAAGGLVDHETVPRLRAVGVDVEAALARNDSGTVLERANALLVTGGTGTNVADLQVVVLG